MFTQIILIGIELHSFLCSLKELFPYLLVSLVMQKVYGLIAYHIICTLCPVEFNCEDREPPKNRSSWR